MQVSGCRVLWVVGHMGKSESQMGRAGDRRGRSEEKQLVHNPD